MFSSYSVRKPYTVFVAIVIVLILGVVSYTGMSIDLIPSINLPYAVVSTSYYGATPEQVELTVTTPLEQSLASLNNIKNIQSVSSENSSMIILEFNEDANMDSAMIEMRENLDLVTSYLPDEVGSPIIIKLNPDMMPIMSISIAVEGMDDAEAGEYINQRLIPEINSINGVASVEANGIIENMVDITISQEKIDALNADIENTFLTDMEATLFEEVEDAMWYEVEAQVRDQIYITFRDQKNAMIAQGMTEEMAEAAIAPARSQAYGQVVSQVSKIVTADAVNEIVQEQLAQIEIPEIEITKDMITGILSAQNFSLPAGSIDTSDGDSNLVRVGDKYASVDEIKSTKLMDIPDYGEVLIDTVCEVHSYDNASDSYSKVNGNYAVVLSIQKQPDFSTADVSTNVREKLDQLPIDYDGVSTAVLMDQGEYVQIMIDAIIQNLLFGGALAVLILYIFLRKIRPTIIVGASIAISVITAFVLMYFSGVTLNLISMGGLALGVGMLVENSIVVIENIFRKKAEGMDAKYAAIEGAKQVSGAIFSSTLTTVIVFVPILFTGGITRQLFTDMALTITFSLLSSLLVALTLVPAASGIMMRRKFEIKPTFIDKISGGYKKFLNHVLNVKWAVVLVAIALLATSVYAAMSSGTELFPSMDSGTITVSIDMPEEYTSQQRFEALDMVNETLLTIEDISTVGIIDSMGSGTSGMMASMAMGSGTTVYVLLDTERVSTTDEIIQEIRDKSADFDFELSAQSSNTDLNALSGGQIVVNVYANELDTLRDTAKTIADTISEVNGTVDVNDGLGTTTPEMRIIVDKNKAIVEGLTTAQIYQTVNDNIKAGSVVTEFTQGQSDFSVYVKDERDDALNETNIMDIVVATKEEENEEGEMVERNILLKDVATLVEADGFSSISHNSQERYLSITGSIETGVNSGDVYAEIETELENLDLAAGTRFEIVGESETIEQTFYDLTLMIALAIVFIYLVMVAQFQSLSSPFIVMFTIPLAFTGGFLALFLTNTPISVVSLIGLVILVGIVVNNGIVFVDYANQQRERGKTTREALLIAAHDRLRPILMTALTTIIALVVMAFDNSSGSEMMRPMAITTIGGLIYSTILTLFLVPAMYEYMHSDKRREKKLARKKKKEEKLASKHN